jgi:hypothetical protein
MQKESTIFYVSAAKKNCFIISPKYSCLSQEAQQIGTDDTNFGEKTSIKPYITVNMKTGKIYQNIKQKF